MRVSCDDVSFVNSVFVVVVVVKRVFYPFQPYEKNNRLEKSD